MKTRQMKNRKVLTIVTLVVLLLLLIGGTTAMIGAQSGDGYDLSWWTADGGGGVSTGGEYTLQGTAGQADAGTLSGGDYELAGGFWAGAEERATVYVPLVTRD